MKPKFGVHYFRLTQGDVGDMPFLVCVHERWRRQLRERFPKDVIYSRQELEVLDRARATIPEVHRVHLIKETFPDAVVASFEPGESHGKPRSSERGKGEK